MRPVAVTELAVVHGFGTGPTALARALLAGETARTKLTEDWAAAVGVHQAVCVPLPDEGDRPLALLEATAVQLAPPTGDPQRRGVFVGMGLSSVVPAELEQEVYRHVRDGRLDRLAALAALESSALSPARHRPERVAAWLCRHLRAHGPGHTSFSACAAGAEAVAAAARAIARGELDVAYAAAVDTMVHPLGMLSFQALGALGEGRPFWAGRDGFLLGEAAVVVRLEARPTAKVRGWVLGAGSSLDAYRATAPEPEGRGAEAAMRRALQDAGLREVAAVKAHGTGTPVGDRAEALAVARVCGEGTRVCSLKGALGHTLAASGLLELAALFACWELGRWPGTWGASPLAALPVAVATEPGPAPGGPVLANSFGFGGQNTSLVLAPAELA